MEAVAEDLEVKRTLFRDLEAVVGDDALLATNTSSLSVTAVAAPAAASRARRSGCTSSTRPTGCGWSRWCAATRRPRPWWRQPSSWPAPGARRRWCAPRRPASSSTASPGRTTARRSGWSRRAWPTRPPSTRCCARPAASRWGRSSSPTWWARTSTSRCRSRCGQLTFHDPRYAPTVFQQRLVDAGRYGRKTGRGVYAYGADGKATDAEPQHGAGAARTRARRPAPRRGRRRVRRDAARSCERIETGRRPHRAAAARRRGPRGRRRGRHRAARRCGAARGERLEPARRLGRRAGWRGAPGLGARPGDVHAGGAVAVAAVPARGGRGRGGALPGGRRRGERRRPPPPRASSRAPSRCW